MLHSLHEGTQTPNYYKHPAYILVYICIYIIYVYVYVYIYYVCKNVFIKQEPLCCLSVLKNWMQTVV